MAKFEEALKIVLKHEGGYTNIKEDHGGPTNFGITQHDYAVFKGHAVSASDVKAMTAAEAGEIYRKNYWNTLGLDGVQNQMLATILFDQGVLNGTGTAAMLMQKALGVAADGKFGAKSVQAMNDASYPQAIGVAFVKQLQLRYLGIVKKSPSQKIFLAGWMNRTHSLLDQILSDREVMVA